MWCYRILKPVLEGETREAAMDRLLTLPTCEAVEPHEDPRVLSAYFVAGDLNGQVGTTGEERDRESVVVQTLVEHPEALPSTAKLVWLDRGGVLAVHLREDSDAVRAARRRMVEEAEQEVSSAAASFGMSLRKGMQGRGAFGGD